jgi:hypothetical protein
MIAKTPERRRTLNGARLFVFSFRVRRCCSFGVGGALWQWGRTRCISMSWICLPLIRFVFRFSTSKWPSLPPSVGATGIDIYFSNRATRLAARSRTRRCGSGLPRFFGHERDHRSRAWARAGVYCISRGGVPTDEAPRSASPGFDRAVADNRFCARTCQRRCRRVLVDTGRLRARPRVPSVAVRRLRVLFLRRTAKILPSGAAVAGRPGPAARRHRNLGDRAGSVLLFVVDYNRLELVKALANLPRPSYFNDLFAAVNLPFGSAEMLSRVPFRASSASFRSRLWSGSRRPGPGARCCCSNVPKRIGLRLKRSA